MTISAQRFATKTRTWLLMAALTALLIGIGALIGGVGSMSSSSSPSR